jgi:transposase
MLAWEEHVEIHALRAQGWSVSAIARHLGRDRKTVRAYLSSQRTPGVRRPTGEEPVDVHGNPQFRGIAFT